MNRWNDYLRPRATVRNLVLLGLCCLAVNVGLLGWGYLISPGQRLLDIQLLYSPWQANQYLGSIGAIGRQRYLWMLLTLDLAYPAGYAAWMSLALARVDHQRERSWLLAIPLAAAGFDWCENVSLAVLVSCYVEDAPSQIAWISASFTLLKWLAVGASAVAILIGYLRSIFAVPPAKAAGP